MIRGMWPSQFHPLSWYLPNPRNVRAEVAQTRRILPTACTQLTLKTVQNNTFVVHKPLSFMVVYYAAKLTDTHFIIINWYRSNSRELIFAELNCFFVCFVILEIIFMKLYLWNPCSLHWYIRYFDYPRTTFYSDFLIWGFLDQSSIISNYYPTWVQIYCYKFRGETFLDQEVRPKLSNYLSLSLMDLLPVYPFTNSVTLWGPLSFICVCWGREKGASIIILFFHRPKTTSLVLVGIKTEIKNLVTKTSDLPFTPLQTRAKETSFWISKQKDICSFLFHISSCLMMKSLKSQIYQCYIFKGDKFN